MILSCNPYCHPSEEVWVAWVCRMRKEWVQAYEDEWADGDEIVVVVVHDV